MNTDIPFTIGSYTILLRNSCNNYNMHKRAVHLCKCLNKYDHVSHHYQLLYWLLFKLLIRHCSLCAMNKLFKFQCSYASGFTYCIYSDHAKLQYFCPASSVPIVSYNLKQHFWWNALSKGMVMARDLVLSFPSAANGRYVYYF